MKKVGFGLGLLCVAAVSVFLVAANTSTSAEPVPLPQEGTPLPQGQFDAGIAADVEADELIICPEVIWALATGGGTWVSKLQITDRTGGSIVRFLFYYGSSSVSGTLWTSPGYGNSVKYSNILSTISSITGASQYGRVGTLYLYTQDAGHIIMADVETVNGNYGKTFPGLQWTDENSININRPGVIQNLTNTSQYRTFVGCWNGAAGGWTMTVTFQLGNSSWVQIGSSFQKTIGAWDFVSFDPFVEAGVSGGSYDNVVLYASVSVANPSPYEKGLFWFGARANNTSNDPAALISKNW
jgi:hypothetical protein